jgi:hypothetical protein
MLRQAASIASRLACRDDRDTPLSPRRDASDETTDLGSKSRNILIIGKIDVWHAGMADERSLL